MQDKQNLCILFGGCSSEYEVSLCSAAAVMRAVDTARYRVWPVGITRQGEWFFCDASPDDVEAGRWQQAAGCVPAVLSPCRSHHGLLLLEKGGAKPVRIDVALPVMHGKNGEDGTVQGLLELAGIPVAGCGCLASALLMDKEFSHRLAEAAGVPGPRFATLYERLGAEEQVKSRLEGVPFPWFVKPAREGSSFGITRVERSEELAAALDEAFRYDGKVVVEEGIGGFEVGCAVMGNTAPRAGEVDGILLQGGFFNFYEKYNLDTSEIQVPAPVPAAVRNMVRETACRLYRMFGCRGFARFDFFLDENGKLYFNEANTIPGLTPHSRFPGMMRAAGVPFEEMVAQLLEMAVEP